MKAKSLIAAAVLSTASLAAFAGETYQAPTSPVGASTVDAPTLIWSDNQSGFALQFDGVTRQVESAPMIDTKDLYVA